GSQLADLLVRTRQELVERPQLVHDLERRRVDRVAAEVAEEVAVLFEHEHVHAGAGQEDAEHHPGRPSARDATTHGLDVTCHRSPPLPSVRPPGTACHSRRSVPRAPTSPGRGKVTAGSRGSTRGAGRPREHFAAEGRDMQYHRISADCHIDLPWIPPDLFTSNARAALRDRMPYVTEGP